MHDVASNGKYMQLARKYGLETTTFAATELGCYRQGTCLKLNHLLKVLRVCGQRSKVFFN